MRTIPLSRGLFAMVDDVDYAVLSMFKWHAVKNGHTQNFYAVRRADDGSEKKVKMHRQILGVCGLKVLVDHKNHNSLDNRRDNLRVATGSQNASNRRGANANSSSGMRGVCLHSPSGKWTAQIQVDGRRTRLGLFETASDAARAYAVAREKHYRDFMGAA